MTKKNMTKAKLLTVSEDRREGAVKQNWWWRECSVCVWGGQMVEEKSEKQKRGVQKIERDGK